MSRFGAGAACGDAFQIQLRNQLPNSPTIRPCSSRGCPPLLDAKPNLELLGQARKGNETWEIIEARQLDVAILDIRTPEITCIEVSRNTVNAGLSTHAVF